MFYLVMVQILGKGTVVWGGGSARWGSFDRYFLRGQMNTLGKKFPWGIWRLGETMPDKPKE